MHEVNMTIDFAIVSISSSIETTEAEMNATLEEEEYLRDLEDGILNFKLMVELANADDTDKPSFLSYLGVNQYTRFECLGELTDLDDSISNLQMGVEFIDDDHSEKAKFLSYLGSGLYRRFQRNGDLADLDNSISSHQRAVELIGDVDTDNRTDVSDPAISLQLSPNQPRYQSGAGDLTSELQISMEAAPYPRQDKHTFFACLGASLQTRFKKLERPADLENAISYLRRAVELTHDGHSDQPAHLSILGISQLQLFTCFGELADLNEAIAHLQRAVELANDDNPKKPNYLFNLGRAHQKRFECLGDLQDLVNAILNLQDANELTEDHHPEKVEYLAHLAANQLDLFEHLGNNADVENAIKNMRAAAELTDNGHPRKSVYLSGLANCLQRRFESTDRVDDLIESIAHRHKATELLRDDDPHKPVALTNLGASLQTLFVRLGKFSDLEDAIVNLRDALKLAAADDPDKPYYLSNLGLSQQRSFGHLGKITDIDNAISNIELAVALTSDDHPEKPVFLSNLGISQQSRYGRLGQLVDITNAVSNHRKAVELTKDSHPELPGRLSNLGNSQRTLFERLGDLGDIYNSIFSLQRAVRLTGNNHPEKPARLANLAGGQHKRFEHLGRIADVEDAISNLSKAVKLTDDSHPHKPKFLSSLGSSQYWRFERLNHWADIENAASNQQKAVKLTDDSHPDKPMRLSNLAVTQQARFGHLGDLADIDRAIFNLHRAFELTDDDDPDKPLILINLGVSRYSRFDRLREQADFEGSVTAFRTAAQSNTAYPRYALLAARKWAEISYLNRDIPSALDGYRTAINILPKVVWLGLDVTTRQDWLLQVGSEDLGCRAASCAIRLGLFEDAVELLDLGRSVFWQQASLLRSDVEVLREDQPELAERLETIGRQLNAGNFSGSSFNSREQGSSTGTIGSERRQLVGEWEALVERIQQLPKFGNFHKPMPFNQLRQAATSGHIIIVNISDYGADALIFDKVHPIQHIPLPDIDSEIIKTLASNISLNRPTNPTPEQRQKYITRFLRHALRTVWSYIIVPIFDTMQVSLEGNSSTPQQRIWWYSTGPLAFIPIHAAGPSSKVDVSRLVISSYVTTLASLAQAQNVPVIPRILKLLAVSQPDTPGQKPLPLSTKEAEKVAAMFYAAGCSIKDITHLNGSHATVNEVSQALDTCSWVHLACHGFQDSKAMKSSLALHFGDLELGEIAAKRLTTGRFAFLSACHAASGLEKLPGESMHLAAGFQFAGFPSVIATMWAIKEEDASYVAAKVYKHLLRNGLQKCNPSEAATALNLALLSLRGIPEVTLDRWSPFIHFGI
jgi:tetratricopeptide (TPR) repeat protein